MTTLYAVLPNDIDDPATPSGGNRYDRRVLDGLAALGWSVREHAVPGAWPTPADGRAGRAGRGRWRGCRTAALVLVDGLVGSAVADVLVPAAARLRLVLLVHLPLDGAGEAAVLAAARAVVTTSPWTRTLARCRRRSPRPASTRPRGRAGSAAGDRLLCVAAVAAHKGHDLLVDALPPCPSRSPACAWAR